VGKLSDTVETMIKLANLYLNGMNLEKANNLAYEIDNYLEKY